MTDAELRELDEWIAENVFGLELEEGDGCKILKDAWKLGDILKYSSNGGDFVLVKREIERRGWFWQCSSFPNRWFQFTVDAPGITVNRRDANTEELAGCLAVKAAIEGAA